jgi:hypothetical protein
MVIETPTGDTETYIHGDTDTHRRHRRISMVIETPIGDTETYIHGDTDTHRRHRDVYPW